MLTRAVVEISVPVEKYLGNMTPNPLLRNSRHIGTRNNGSMAYLGAQYNLMRSNSATPVR